MSQYEFIKSWTENGVAWISVNRPPYNVLDIPTMKEMNLALAEVKKSEEDFKALVITAEGPKAFSAGVDVSDHTEEMMDEMIGTFHDIFLNIEKLQLPVIAAVRGAALGGGCELAIACDMIVASDTLKIGQPEIQVGVFPPIAAVLLPRLIPAAKAFELIVGGGVIRAQEAKEIGLVNHVFPDGEFEESFAKFLGSFTALSASVMKVTKKAIRAAQGLPFTDALHKVEGLYLGELMETEDAKEGLSAFMEKRKPVWKDK